METEQKKEPTLKEIYLHLKEIARIIEEIMGRGNYFSLANLTSKTNLGFNQAQEKIITLADYGFIDYAGGSGKHTYRILMVLSEQIISLNERTKKVKEFTDLEIKKLNEVCEARVKHNNELIQVIEEIRTENIK